MTNYPQLDPRTWATGHPRLTVGVDSNVSGEIIESALTLARDRFPELRVYSFGSDSLHPQLDLYIRRGKPFNVLSSQWIVVAICWFGLAFNKGTRRLGGHDSELDLFSPITRVPIRAHS